MRKRLAIGTIVAATTAFAAISIRAQLVEVAGVGTYTLAAPTHAWVDFCAASWFDETCTTALATAGACTVVGDPLPTQTCSAANVAAGRCRAAVEGQQIPKLAECGAYVHVVIKRWGRDTRDRGRIVLYQRSQTPPATGEDF